MSFITKRERVFNDYDLFDLPARNEGKLKAYASCTDARAWSHFHSDKTEHLVDIIKRNNDKCAPKYVPTTVIVDTLMSTKNAEIGRLKRKVEALEQMMAVYDDLNLDCTQKCDIAKAHEAIRAANKELDEMCLDLNISGFTEGIDSDVYETGKSRGDEVDKTSQKEIGYDMHSTPRVDSKGVQLSFTECTCEASTNATDPRIDEMQEDIIGKDAKLSAMQNTIAAMENDICEPYCIYAHIYTALEKIFGILYQNEKYKEYLDLLTADKDTRNIDIKGKILFKMKVLEKFCLALIAPCSQDLNKSKSAANCSCYQALVARVETTLALTTAEAAQPASLDSKRAQLVAEIMDNAEMKEILSKESCFVIAPEQTEEEITVDYYNIDAENLNRIKDLQKSYDELMACYENLKHDRDCLQLRCHRYNELEIEVENLQCQVRAYSALWNEKEHYRKRSEDLDNLKEKFVVLFDEASGLETQLKSETERNYNKNKTIEDLRHEIVHLEKKLNEASISFEREKIALQCKLKETECKCMCQDQQVKQLTVQLDKHMEKTHEKELSDSANSIGLLNEIAALKDQTKNLKDLLFCSEEEKLHMQEEFEDKFNVINALKMEIEEWKCSYEKLVDRNNYLEKCAENCNDLEEKNKALIQNLEKKDEATNNLMGIISDKSSEIQKLLDEIDRKRQENKELLNELKNIQVMYNNQIDSLENDKQLVLDKLHVEKKGSQELIARVKEYDSLRKKEDEATRSLQIKSQDNDELKETLSKVTEDNEALRAEIEKLKHNHKILLLEIQNSYEKEQKKIENERDAALKQQQVIQNGYEVILNELNKQKQEFAALMQEKNRLDVALDKKAKELEDATNSIQLSHDENEELIDKLRVAGNMEQEYSQLRESYKHLVKERNALRENLADKNKNIETLVDKLNNLKEANSELADHVSVLELNAERMSQALGEMHNQNRILENELQEKSSQLMNKLQSKDLEKEEVSRMAKHINYLEDKNKIYSDKLKHFEKLADDYDKLNQNYDQVRSEKSTREREYENLRFNLEQEIKGLNEQMQKMFDHNQQLEEIFVRARHEEFKESEPEFDYNNVKEEIAKLKREKIASASRIRELLNKLDENDNTISNLAQELLARDDKIAVLENHINGLEDEVRLLQGHLEEGLNAGLDMAGSVPRIDETLKQMEAHHSKATHNMKVEMAKLQKENSLLEEKLSITKLKNEDTIREKHNYISQLQQLQNERDIIISQVQQLELTSIGDSELSRDRCDVEHVVEAIDKVRRSIDTRNSQNNSLEKTLLKMQSSSQLVLSKADEAKKIAENEKQKIMNEKEEAIKERLFLEQKMAELKDQLKKQSANDEKVIKDLEAEILNQKLIINNINETRESYIKKLQEEIDTLQDLYKNSQKNIANLETRLKNITHDNENNLKMINKIKTSLEEKSKEVIDLQNKLHSLQSQIKGNQKPVDKTVNKSVQTEIEQSHKYNTLKHSSESYQHQNIENIGIPARKHFENKTQNNTPDSNKTMNEVQILRANIEPNLDLARNIYQNYKINKLSPGPMEVNSIASFEEDDSKYDMCETQGFTEDSEINDQISHSDILHDLSHDKVAHKEYPEKKKFHVSQPPDFQEDVKINGSTDKTANQRYSKKKSIPEKNKTYHNPNDIEIEDLNKLSGHKIGQKEYSGKTTIPKSQQPFSIRSDASKNISSNRKTYEESPEKKTITNKQQYYNETFEDVDNRDGPQSKNKQDHSRVNTELEYDELENDSRSKKSKEADSSLASMPNETNSDKDVFIIFRDTDSVKSKRSHEWPRHTKAKDTPIEKFHKNQTEKQDKVNHTLKKASLNLDIPQADKDLRSKVLTTRESETYTANVDSEAIQPNTLPEHKSRSDVGIAENYITNTSKTPSEPSLSHDRSYQDSLYSTEIVSDEETIKKLLKKQLSDTDDEKLKQKLISSKSNKSFFRTDGEKSIETTENTSDESHHSLSRIDADLFLHKPKEKSQDRQSRHPPKENFGLEYIMNTVRQENYPRALNAQRSSRDGKHEGASSVTSKKHDIYEFDTISSGHNSFTTLPQTNVLTKDDRKSMTDKSVNVDIDPSEYYDKKIQRLSKTIENIDKDYKKKIGAIKDQYDTNIKKIITEHNHGVKSIQNLHEDTLQDILKTHENEVENLREMSIEAMTKAEKLEKVNKDLMHQFGSSLQEDPVKITELEEPLCRARARSRKTLSKTSVESFSVNPKSRTSGLCTCTLDINASDTIRNIFDQVDVEQKKMAEYAYVKYIANKMLTGSVENLDSQELTFLHHRVCRSWKSKISKEEALQRRIDTLETELMSKQRNAQEHIAELDRKVAEERRRLQEVREAVCSTSPSAAAAEKDIGCTCSMGRPCRPENYERRSAGDLNAATAPPYRPKRPTHRSVTAKPEHRRGERCLDEQPTRLRKNQNCSLARPHKK